MNLKHQKVNSLTQGELLELVKNHANLTEANLREADLRGANLREADLRWANLSGANLRGANLRGAKLRGAKLRGAKLRGAKLRGADLSGADLSGADLRGANLRGADLRWANLSGANLRGANLTGADLRGVELSATGGISFDWHKPDPSLPLRVAQAAMAPSGLDMSEWHTCDTTHCLAGWAIHLSGPLGAALEGLTSPSVAASILLPSASHLFFSDNAEATAWCQEQINQSKP